MESKSKYQKLEDTEMQLFLPSQEQKQPQQQQTNLKQLSCSGCKAILQFQNGAYIVQCPACNVSTAAQNLHQIMCGRCKSIVVYPVGAQLVKCPCGAINKI